MLLVLVLSCTVSNLYAEEIDITIPVDSSEKNSTVLMKSVPIAVQEIKFENSAVHIVTDGKLTPLFLITA